MEDKKQYIAGQDQKPINEKSLLKFSDQEFEAPTDADVRSLHSQSGLTGSQLAQLAGISPRTWRKYCSPPGCGSASAIPYAVWRLLLIELGFVKV